MATTKRPRRMFKLQTCVDRSRIQLSRNCETLFLADEERYWWEIVAIATQAAEDIAETRKALANERRQATREANRAAG